jgi:hypothetical protein
MKILGLSGFALALVTILASLVGCSPQAGTPREQGPVSLGIECQAFYRPSVEQAPDEGTVINLSGHGDLGRAEYADMVFDAQFNDDPGEGPSLVISITTREGGDQILRQLYQIDREEGIQNQFIGGHGFTGLIYVYHPASTAEMQYFCRADAQ